MHWQAHSLGKRAHVENACCGFDSRPLRGEGSNVNVKLTLRALERTDNAYLRSQLEHRVRVSSPETRPPSTTELHAGSDHQDSREYGGAPHFSAWKGWHIGKSARLESECSRKRLLRVRLSSLPQSEPTVEGYRPPSISLRRGDPNAPFDDNLLACGWLGHVASPLALKASKVRKGPLSVRLARHPHFKRRRGACRFGTLVC